MSGFSATLNKLCAGTASLEAVLAAFNREPPRDWDAFLQQSMLIESAWRGGKLDRPSYERLRNAVLARSSDLVAGQSHDTDPMTAYDSPVFPSWDPQVGDESPGDEVRIEDVSAEEDSTLFRPTDRQTREQRTNLYESQAAASRGASAPSTPSGKVERLTHPSQWSDGPPKSVGPGSVLKERFVLEEVIGRGGMGTIFRAKDLRKEEAQDRYPYVAVKVLNEDFRKHPESLKTLQREARKAQSLAHPNVASVFDFDRDGPLVFLVMELLEGVSLDRLIKSRAGRGLPRTEALRIVEGLCAALAYAHQKGVVHSDFKPANAFRTRDGSVKVLDFGIARAVGRLNKGADQTVFDPGTLGALTPCYASPEMLVGEPPDPRDDVFALACVTYELFCSRHPFNFTSALLAERRSMKPAPIPGLDGRTWRGLQRGLAFGRASRTESVPAFLAEIAPRRRFRVAAAAAAVVAAVALGGVAWKMVPEYLDEQNHGRYAAQLQSGDPQVIAALLPQLRALPVPKLRALLSDSATKDSLIDHFERNVHAAIDEPSGHMDYEKAERALDEVDALLPDSSRIARLRAAVMAKKQAAVARYSAALSQQIAQGWLTDAQNPQNVVRTIATLRQIDPRWQPDLGAVVGAFTTEIRQAIAKEDAASATQLLAAATEIAPGAPEMQALELAINQRTAVARSDEQTQPPPRTEAPVAEPRRADPPPIVAQAPTPAPPASAGSGSPVPDRSLSVAQRKQRVLALAGVNDVPEALGLFRTLQTQLPADDPFIAVEGPVAIAQSYSRLSERAFERGEFEAAAALLTRAAEFAPDLPGLTARRESVDRLGRLAHTLENAVSISAESVNAELEQVRVSEGSTYLLIRSQLAETLVRRIRELQSVAPPRANDLLKVGQQVFAGSVALESVRPVDDPQGATLVRQPADAQRAEASSSLGADAEGSKPR